MSDWFNGFFNELHFNILPLSIRGTGACLDIPNMVLPTQERKISGCQAPGSWIDVENKANHQMNMKAGKRNLKQKSTSAIRIFTNTELTKAINTKISFEELEKALNKLDDLGKITQQSDVKTVEAILVKYCSIMSSSIEAFKKNSGKPKKVVKLLLKLSEMMVHAWKVPTFGHELGTALSKMLKYYGGLDYLIDNCVTDKEELQFGSARLLQECLITENRDYVVENGLGKVVTLAKKYTDDISNTSWSQVGTGILEHLFRHSEVTCSDVIAMGGLDTVVNECKSTDVQTLRQCASALANVAMYGGSENQEAMIQRKVQIWLFPLAFHSDDTVKYFACLAIAVLVANKEIEAAVQKSGTLELIDPFVQSHSPAELAVTSAAYSYGQSPIWLRKLIPVLCSHREEARNLAAFHFCMEAEIKKMHGNTHVFSEIGCIESLRKLASGPNGIAAKYAAQTLRLVGEEVPHKLSQQVPTWSIEDVMEWVKQIGFASFARSFEDSRVDGDLLLQLSEEMLRDDIGIENGILRRRFLREIMNLKRMADYSSCDISNLCSFLMNLGPEFVVYAYDLIKAGIDRETLMSINEEQLLSECGILNTIHRLKILQGVKVARGEVNCSDDSCTVEKNLDVFISYRQPNGSQLASLLKVHLELRNFSVFLDVDRLESGKLDSNHLQTVRSARNFVLVLTPGALDGCLGDEDQHDWIHKEVACALSSECKVIPVFDNFIMPEPSLLPKSMQAICSYNGVKWIHDYQDACVDKIDRFIRGDHVLASGGSSTIDRLLSGGSQTSRQNAYQRGISYDSIKAASAASSSDLDPPSTSEKEIQQIYPPSPKAIIDQRSERRTRWPRSIILTKSLSVNQRIVGVYQARQITPPMIFGPSSFHGPSGLKPKRHIASMMSTPASSIDNIHLDQTYFGRRRSLSLDDIGVKPLEAEDDTKLLKQKFETITQEPVLRSNFDDGLVEDLKAEMEQPCSAEEPARLEHGDASQIIFDSKLEESREETLSHKSLSSLDIRSKKHICDKIVRPRSHSLGFVQICLTKWKKTISKK